MVCNVSPPKLLPNPKAKAPTPACCAKGLQAGVGGRSAPAGMAGCLGFVPGVNAALDPVRIRLSA